MPGYTHPGDAGADLYAASPADIKPGGRAIVPTGVAIELPDGYVGLVHPRSGLAAKLGVTVLTQRTVVGVDGEGVTIEHGGSEPERIPSRTVIWAAGVTASGLATRLAELTGAESDRAGRLTVEPDLTLPDHPEVRVVDDRRHERRDEIGDEARSPQ